MRLIENRSYREDLEHALRGLDLSMLRGHTVLITGGLGLIGSAVADLLWTAGVGVVIADLSAERFEQRYGGIPGIRFVRYDALEPLDLPFVPDEIVCGAGITNPEAFLRLPVETVMTNLGGVKRLLDFARENGVKRLLYISSSEVYGKKDTDVPFREGVYGSVDPDTLRSSYPIAKTASELICRAYAAEYGVDTVIVRPGHIYGPAASEQDTRASSAFAWQAARGEPLVLKSPGLQKRSYCYSIDCAAALLTVLTRGETGLSYNLGHASVTTIREMAQILAEAGGVELTAAEPTGEERSAFNPMDNSSLNDERLRSLGYRDTFTVHEGLSHTVRIMRACLQG